MMVRGKKHDYDGCYTLCITIIYDITLYLSYKSKIKKSKSENQKLN